MPRLWRSLFGRPEERAADPAISLADWHDMMSYQNLTYLLGGSQTSMDTESIENSFTGYVNGIYKTNGIVFALMEARRSVFTEARFQFQRINKGRPGELFGSPALNLLEYPWPNGTTGELLSRAIQDVDLTGNHYIVREPGRLRRLRPDWVTIILSAAPDQAVKSDVMGYAYWPGGINNGTPQLYLPEEVAHWCPIPDPEAQYRGMSWLTPVLREVQADKAYTDHKAKFTANAATPKLSVSLKENVTKAQFLEFIEAFEAANGGIENAYKTLYMGGGADVSVVGANMVQMDFKAVQGAGETRLAAAAGVPSVVVGFSEGMQGSSLNAGNYKSAKESFAERTLRPLWRSVAASYQSIIDMPSRNGTVRLWYDDRDIAFLRTDLKEAADIMAQDSASIIKFVQGGFTPESSVSAVAAKDATLLEHSGLLSVQLIPPGQNPSDAALPDDSKPPALAPGAPPPKALPPGQGDKAPADDEKKSQANSRWVMVDMSKWDVTERDDADPKAPARHGNKGDPGYSLLHPGSGGGSGLGVSTKDHLNPDEEGILHEDLSDAFFAGFTPRDYSPFADPGSHEYDEDSELGEEETAAVDYDGLGRFYASTDHWFGDFDQSRRARRAANELLGLDQGQHDLLLGDGEVSQYDRAQAFGMTMALATSKPYGKPLVRGSWYEGADPAEIEKAFRDQGTMDFSLVSFSNSQGVADYFADPEFYGRDRGGSQGGTQVMFTVEPGAQAIMGRRFNSDMKAGDPGSELSDLDEDDPALLLDPDPDAAREYVTGGRFKIKGVTRKGDTISVTLAQQYTYNPVTGRTTP